ncbi:MAG: hypothetical protein ACRCYR_03745 [Phycicoccus sp.]
MAQNQSTETKSLEPAQTENKTTKPTKKGADEVEVVVAHFIDRALLTPDDVDEDGSTEYAPGDRVKVSPVTAEYFTRNGYVAPA